MSRLAASSVPAQAVRRQLRLHPLILDISVLIDVIKHQLAGIIQTDIYDHDDLHQTLNVLNDVLNDDNCH